MTKDSYPEYMRDSYKLIRKEKELILYKRGYSSGKNI
jgi:hypothetical protein